MIKNQAKLLQYFETEKFNHNIYNFTITFDPKKYNLAYTWSFDMDQEISAVLSKYSNNWYYAKEMTGAKSPIDKRTKAFGYCHIHGQCYLHKTEHMFAVEKIRKAIRKFGSAQFKENETLEQKNEGKRKLGLEYDENPEHKTYYAYAMKNVEENTKKFEELAILKVKANLQYFNENNYNK